MQGFEELRAKLCGVSRRAGGPRRWVHTAWGPCRYRDQRQRGRGLVSEPHLGSLEAEKGRERVGRGFPEEGAHPWQS